MQLLVQLLLLNGDLFR